MVEVNVILPDGSKKKGRIDPDVSFDEMKEAIVNAFMRGKDPDDYEIAITPKTKKASSYKVSSGDLIHIIEMKSLRGPVFIPESE